MTGFITKKITRRVRPLGSLLKSARLKAELTLEQAEVQTRINSKYLRALEEGDYNQLPGEAYNVGFVRGYATLLKLPVDKTVLAYKQERSQFQSGSTAPQVLAPRRAAEWRFFITPKVLGVVAALALFGGIASYIAVQLRSFTQPPKLQISSLPAEFTTNKNIVRVEGATIDGAVVTINTEAIHVASSGAFSQDVQLNPGVNDIVVTARSRAMKETRQIFQVLYNQDLANLPRSDTKE